MQSWVHADQPPLLRVPLHHPRRRVPQAQPLLERALPAPPFSFELTPLAIRPETTFQQRPADAPLIVFDFFLNS